jgi:Mitochondrial biogenesis AIM24
VEGIACSWCHYPNEPDRVSCGTCGAPLAAAKAESESESGWRAAPRLQEMTEFRVGDIACQVAGQVVPVAEFTLAEGDVIFFEQHTLLWKERTVSLTGKNLKTAGQRTIAGMPHTVIEARGPGRMAVTRDASGEVVVLPLHPGVETDVRGHAFLAASQNVGYSFIRIDKLASMLHGGPGMYLDRFVAGDTQGLLLLHGYGNVFQRRRNWNPDPNRWRRGPREREPLFP